MANSPPDPIPARPASVTSSSARAKRAVHRRIGRRQKLTNAGIPQRLRVRHFAAKAWWAEIALYPEGLSPVEAWTCLASGRH